MGILLKQFCLLTKYTNSIRDNNKMRAIYKCLTFFHLQKPQTLLWDDGSPLETSRYFM